MNIRLQEVELRLGRMAQTLWLIEHDVALMRESVGFALAALREGGSEQSPLATGPTGSPPSLSVCARCGGDGNEWDDSMSAFGVPGGMVVIGPCPDCANEPGGGA